MDRGSRNSCCGGFADARAHEFKGWRIGRLFMKLKKYTVLSRMQTM